MSFNPETFQLQIEDYSIQDLKSSLATCREDLMMHDRNSPDYGICLLKIALLEQTMSHRSLRRRW